MTLHPFTEPTTYGALIETARDLTEGDGSTQDNPEYTRGIVELLANTFGYGAFVDDGDGAKDQIQAEIAAPNVYEQYPIADWRYEVANDDTHLGYREWLEHKVEAAAESEN